MERAWDAGQELCRVDRTLSVDAATSLPNDLLVKMDIASMANSLEARSPLLDQDVVEFMARLPGRLKLRYGLSPKYLLKRLARRCAPGQNIDRPKMGFGVPLNAWLRGSLREMAAELLLSPRTLQRGVFQPEPVRRVWAEHQSGAQDHAYPLWTLMMFELWHRECLDAAVAAGCASGA
jgi:asparagine synthase (glutamine-hydrolysing)